MRYAGILLVGVSILFGLSGCMKGANYQTQWTAMEQTRYSREQSFEVCKLEANSVKSGARANYTESQKEKTLNCYGNGSAYRYGSTVRCTESINTPTYGSGAQGALGGALNAWRVEKSRQLLTILEVAPSSSESGKEFTDADRADADLVHTLQRPEHIVVSSLRMRVDVGIDQKSSHFHSSGSMDR